MKLLEYSHNESIKQTAEVKRGNDIQAELVAINQAKKNLNCMLQNLDDCPDDLAREYLASEKQRIMEERRLAMKKSSSSRPQPSVEEDGESDEDKDGDMTQTQNITSQTGNQELPIRDGRLASGYPRGCGYPAAFSGHLSIQIPHPQPAGGYPSATAGILGYPHSKGPAGRASFSQRGTCTHRLEGCPPIDEVLVPRRPEGLPSAGEVLVLVDWKGCPSSRRAGEVLVPRQPEGCPSSRQGTCTSPAGRRPFQPAIYPSGRGYPLGYPDTRQIFEEKGPSAPVGGYPLALAGIRQRITGIRDRYPSTISTSN
ncbi:uncharacterized protein PGTG_20006 [Puccinia graminis f. sp. tritici CRL 75-36-700-3]|uniref:No apical meristem-associated C-terminal domain-containing protein n=1 Tax=Puccinia graminis f. sp. tritici (strain CRL 75-36-700-3 / race SCCL) TaxID=418459 RepID=E3LBX0_PUCGT|nr:uncharacterized protein PGTG_20006 [Puccinia graminis f. sp. tritici CRL 75-36-700-3]EFP94045.2 hypothetical protein PGTG_20006 [Puccinia graminis f. sp. tritici CRL 75-36-700-3]